MATVRSRAITSLTAAAALALGVIPAAFTASSILASGEDVTTIAPATDYFPGPTMTLTATGTQGVIAVGGTSLRQTFTGGQYCELSTGAGSNDLLDLDGAIGPGNVDDPLVGSAGFRDGALGVYEGTNASQCFRVDANSFTNAETLVLSLGADLQGMRGSSVTFDLMKQSGELDVVATLLDGSEVVGTGSWTSPKREKVGTRKALTVSGDVGRTFDKVQLKAKTGSFSVVGTSTFQLVQPADAKFCSNPTQADETDNLTEGNASVTYVGNADGTDSCFPVLLTAGPTEVRFLKPDRPVDAQFVFDVVWTLPNEGGTPEVLIPDAAIDFEVGSTNFTDMPFCSDFDDTGVLGPQGSRTVLDYQTFTTSAEFRDFEPGTTAHKEFACIDTRTSEITSGEIRVFDTIFVIGDLKMFPSR